MTTNRGWLFFCTVLLCMLAVFGPVRVQAQGTGAELELAVEAAIFDAGLTIPHQSPLRPSGTGWAKLNGKKVTNRRITINLWKGPPFNRRSAISGRADGRGAWRWRQRPKSQGYAPFDIEPKDVIHVIMTNGDRFDHCYRIVEVRTDKEGFVAYFKGKVVPCD